MTRFGAPSGDGRKNHNILFKKRLQFINVVVEYGIKKVHL